MFVPRVENMETEKYELRLHYSWNVWVVLISTNLLSEIVFPSSSLKGAKHRLAFSVILKYEWSKATGTRLSSEQRKRMPEESIS